MAAPSSLRSSSEARPVPEPISGAENAKYTRDLLENLRAMALRQEQWGLARLLEEASREAGRLARA